MIYKAIGIGHKFDTTCESVVILGGSSSQLGKEICKLLVMEHRVAVINIDHFNGMIFNEESLQYYKFIECDLQNPIQVAKIMKEKLKEPKFPAVSCLINSTQFGKLDMESEVVQLQPTVLEQCITENLISPMIAIKHFLNEIVPRTITRIPSLRGIYIVNITDTATLDPGKYGAQYITSKAGINQFHDGLTSELYLNRKYQNLCCKTLLAYVPTKSIQSNKESRWAQDLIEKISSGQRGEVVLGNKKLPADYRTMAKFWSLSVT